MTDEVSFPAPYAVDVALSRKSHERAGVRRTDQAWLDEVWASPSTRVVVLAKGRFPVSDSSVEWLSPQDAPDGRRLFLGLRDDVPHFAVLAGEDAVETDRAWTTLRQVGPKLGPEEAGLLIHAVALAEWHRSHRHCPWCGGGLEPKEAGHVMQCPDCGRQQFPRTDPAVIMLVTDGERALLGHNADWPEGRYSTLAGFVDPGESFEAAVAREVMEETGVEVTDVTYFGNQPWPFPASLMVGFFARAVTTDINVDGSEIADARWFTREDIKTGAETGALGLPGGISISRSLVEAWYGAAIPASW